MAIHVDRRRAVQGSNRGARHAKYQAGVHGEGLEAMGDSSETAASGEAAFTRCRGSMATRKNDWQGLRGLGGRVAVQQDKASAEPWEAKGNDSAKPETREARRQCHKLRPPSATFYGLGDPAARRQAVCYVVCQALEARENNTVARGRVRPEKHEAQTNRREARLYLERSGERPGAGARDGRAATPCSCDRALEAQ